MKGNLLLFLFFLKTEDVLYLALASFLSYNFASFKCKVSMLHLYFNISPPHYCLSTFPFFTQQTITLWCHYLSSIAAMAADIIREQSGCLMQSIGIVIEPSFCKYLPSNTNLLFSHLHCCSQVNFLIASITMHSPLCMCYTCTPPPVFMTFSIHSTTL